MDRVTAVGSTHLCGAGGVHRAGKNVLDAEAWMSSLLHSTGLQYSIARKVGTNIYCVQLQKFGVISQNSQPTLSISGQDLIPQPGRRAHCGKNSPKAVDQAKVRSHGELPPMFLVWLNQIIVLNMAHCRHSVTVEWINMDQRPPPLGLSCKFPDHPDLGCSLIAWACLPSP